MMVVGSKEGPTVESSNWRSKGRATARGSFGPQFRQAPPDLFRSYTKRRKPLVVLKDGQRMKFCPGANCQLFLPTYQFLENTHMHEDRLDTYCIECNLRRRREEWSGCGMGGPSECELSAWRRGEGIGASPMPVMKRDVVQRIQLACERATKTYGATVPFSASTIYCKIFDGLRLTCEVTGKPMTPACFMEHHGIRIVMEENERFDVKCSKCSVPKRN